MGKICILLALALLLTGCGPAESAASSADSGSQEEHWGVMPEELTSPEELASPEEPSMMEADSADEAASAAEASVQEEPVETQAPPQSLTELYAPSCTVWIDGQALEGIVLSGTTLVNGAALTERFSWLRQSGDTFILPDGTALELALCSVDAADPDQPVYDGSGGICFDGAEYWLPIRAVTEALGYSLLWDPDTGDVYVSSLAVDLSEVQGSRVPVLMYHAVSDDLWGIEELFVSPENMRSQLEYLTENGYDPIFFSDLPNLDQYDKPIILTFDDGYDDNYEYLFPLLREFGVKATVFVISDMLGDEHYLTDQQAREMSDSGLVDIQSHTATHQQLATLTAEEQEEELSRSRLEIARVTGKLPYVLAYPNGSYDSDTLALAARYYQFGMKMNGGSWYIGENRYEVDRIYISRYDTLSDYESLLG